PPGRLRGALERPDRKAEIVPLDSLIVLPQTLAQFVREEGN
ncbi:MAG: hypothetical protein QOE55_1125, partial [Acidobacteriaceae bacterium]|nr:hypothetical protein [Acidobacteriaceae bacterium]